MILDAYSNQLIARCRALSPGIDAYFSEERYREELDPEDEITPQYLVDAAISLVMDKLRDIGIISNFSVGEILDNAFDMEVMFYLASKFDANNYYNLLSCFDDKEMSEYTAMLENISYPEDYLFDLSDYFNQLFPLDVGWEYISRSTDRWGSTMDFVTHIANIQLKIEVNRDSVKAPVGDTDVAIVKRFIEVMDERDKKVKIYVDYLLEKYGKYLNADKLRNMVRKYDREKLESDKILLFAKWNALPEEEKLRIGTPTFLNNHHLHTNHHIEYWETHKGIDLTPEIAVMIVISLVLDNLPASKMNEELRRYQPIATLPVYGFMMTIAFDTKWKELVGEAHASTETQG